MYANGPGAGERPRNGAVYFEAQLLRVDRPDVDAEGMVT